MAETVSQALIDLAALRECESIQRDAVSVLEKGGSPNLLADALITHGIGLARLKKLEAAQHTLERANRSGRGSWRVRQSGHGRSDDD